MEVQAALVDQWTPDNDTTVIRSFVAAASTTTLRALETLLGYVYEGEEDILGLLKSDHLRDDETLIFACTHYTARFMIGAMESVVSAALTEIENYDNGGWEYNAAVHEDKLYSIIVRSMTILSAAITCMLERMANRKFMPVALHHACLPLDVSKAELHRRNMYMAQRMLNLTIEGLAVPLMYTNAECASTPQGSLRQRCRHIHMKDGLIWPMSDLHVERQLTAFDKPTVTFRSFKYETVPQDDNDEEGITSYDSAYRAIHALSWGEPYVRDYGLSWEQSDDGRVYGLSWGEPYNERHYVLSYRESENGRDYGPWGVEGVAKRAEDAACEDRRKLPQALAYIGLHALVVLRRQRPELELGIILPGGSQIFWPSKSHSGGGDSHAVYIKASEEYVGNETAYHFNAVKLLPPTANEDIHQQTLPFLNLAAEIRNKIYEMVLDNESDATEEARRKKKELRRQQSALSITCRQVNKEMMSLLFRRQKIFVCI